MKRTNNFTCVMASGALIATMLSGHCLAYKPPMPKSHVEVVIPFEIGKNKLSKSDLERLNFDTTKCGEYGRQYLISINAEVRTKELEISTVAEQIALISARMKSEPKNEISISIKMVNREFGQTFQERQSNFYRSHYMPEEKEYYDKKATTEAIEERRRLGLQEKHLFNETHVSFTCY